VASTSCWLGGLAEPCNSVCYIARTAHNAAKSDVSHRRLAAFTIEPQSRARDVSNDAGLPVLKCLGGQLEYRRL
jgi:hypothetical protein